MFSMGQKTCIKIACEKTDDCWMNIDIPDFIHEQRYTGYLEIPRQGSSSLSDVKKNDLRMLRYGTGELLRQDGAKDTRFVLRGCTNLSGGGSTPGTVPEVWSCEAGETGFYCGQSVLYKAVCLLCRTEVSDDDDTGCSQRIEPELAHGQGVGQRIHEKTAYPLPCSRTAGYRDRRSINQERAHVSDRGQRFGAKAADMVWGHGQIRGEP